MLFAAAMLCAVASHLLFDVRRNSALLSPVTFVRFVPTAESAAGAPTNPNDAQPDRVLVPLFRLLGFFVFLLSREDREHWYLIQADLAEDLAEMRAHGYGPNVRLVRIAWEATMELGALLLRRGASVIRLSKLLRKFF